MVQHTVDGLVHAELRRDALERKHHPGPVVELGVHRPRTEGTDIHWAALFPQLLGRAPGQADHIGLAGIVARHVGPAGQQPRGGCHIQDGAAALRLHPAQHKLEQPPHGSHVHLHHLFLFGGVGLQQAPADAKARVVDEDVDALPCQLRAQAVAVRPVGKVGGQDAAHGAVGGVQLLCQCRQPVSPAGGEDETAAHGRVTAGKLPANAGACAGDPDSLFHRVLLCCRCKKSLSPGERLWNSAYFSRLSLSK